MHIQKARTDYEVRVYEKGFRQLRIVFCCANNMQRRRKR